MIIDQSDYSSYELEDIFQNVKALNDHLCGFRLEELTSQELIFSHNDEMFFTPASNTKLLTLYAALNYLPDSIPWMQVYTSDSMRVYEPMGDPSFLHPDLPTPERIRSYFLDHHEAGDTIYMSIAHFRSEKFGPGWAWDDYFYSFQPEMSPFPIHGNILQTDTFLIDNKPVYQPAWLNTDLKFDSLGAFDAYREPTRNAFELSSISERHRIPIIIDTNYYRAYFNHLGLELLIVDTWDMPADMDKNMVFSLPVDSLYRYYVQESDNLIAEQLLLQASMYRYGVMNTAVIIGYAKNDILAPVSDNINWKDGSGLSRYNMLTPAAMVFVLNALYEKIGLERLTQILPAGGMNGTIRDWYSYEPPRVYAKTGSLRYCHNLSGLLKSNSGKWYVFSFMHNNFNVPNTDVKKEMEKVLDVIIKKY
jgi:D-alanyl-D-alanine carboxypeptidase/D-alanyl-D-alanine-endopeptidase (penicillin-binding protein 4)